MASTGCIHMLSGFGVVVGVLVACSMDLGLAPASVHAAADVSNVGALTPFDINNALDLADYCNSTDLGDDTACIGTWIKDAKKQSKHLYVSPGMYLYADGKAIFEGFHLQCADPTRAIFKAINNANDLFVLAPNWASESNAPWQDISIENCGFDLNGSTAHFASVIALAGGILPIQYVTVRGNNIYDSAQPRQMYATEGPPAPVYRYPQH